MEVSKFLAKVLGLYLLIISLAMFLKMHTFSVYINELIQNTPLLFVSGFFTLILGLLMVVAHNIWQWDWRLLVTIIAWLTLLKGISIIFYPQAIDITTVVFLQNIEVAYFSAAFDFVLGAVLTYFGFKKPA